MPWVKIDEHFYDHPKWVDAPGDSIALWLASIAWCNRNDSTEGLIPHAKTRGLVNVRSLRKSLEDLCDRGAFKDTAAGYLIHDYAEFQQPEKVKEIADKRSVAGRKGAAVRWGEYRRAREYAEAPDITNPKANGMAIAIPNAIAKLCPDTDTDSVLSTYISETLTWGVGRVGMEDDQK